MAGENIERAIQRWTAVKDGVVAEAERLQAERDKETQLAAQKVQQESEQEE